MNNEQNNNIFNIPNQNPVQPNNDKFNIFNNVSNAPQTEGQAVSSGIIPVQPITSNVAENVNTSFSNIAGESSNFSEPNISNSVTNDSNIAPTINQNSTEASSSTFDIGLNSSNDVNAEQNNMNTMNFDNTVNSVSVVPNSSPNLNNQGLNQTGNTEAGMVNNKVESNLNNSNQPNNNSGNENIVSVGKYLGYILLFCIPIVGFIMLIVKAFFDKKDKNISNFAKAQLLLSVIAVVLAIIFTIISFAAASSMINNINDKDNSYIDQNNYNYNYDY